MQQEVAQAVWWGLAICRAPDVHVRAAGHHSEAGTECSRPTAISLTHSQGSSELCRPIQLPQCAVQSVRAE